MSVDPSSPSPLRRAFDKHSEEDSNIFRSVDGGKDGHVPNIVEATQQSRDICLEKRLKFTFRGEAIILLDDANKQLAWVTKFRAIGDII